MHVLALWSQVGRIVVAACSLTVLALAPVRGAEADAPVPTVTASDAWARWLPAGLPAAGYLTLYNAGSKEIGLTDVDCPAYGHVMLHESYTTASGANRMRHVDRLAIPAGGTVELKPGSYHLMLMKPKRALQPGDVVTATLSFDDGSTLTVQLTLKPAGTDE